MRRSPFTHHLAKESLAIAARSTNTTVNGTAVDRTDGKHELFRSAFVTVHTGSMTDGTHTIQIQESDDNSTWNAVADSDLEGAEPAIASTDGNSVFELGYTGRKRYVRVSVTVSGATSGGTYGAVVVLYDPSRAAADHS